MAKSMPITDLPISTTAKFQLASQLILAACARCGVVKPRAEFYKYKHEGNNNYLCICQDCHKAERAQIEALERDH